MKGAWTADQNDLAGIGGVHDGERIGHALVKRIGCDIVGPVGLAVAARVVGDAAETFAEIRDLPFVNARMHDAPGRHEEHRLRSIAVDLVVDAPAAAVGVRVRDLPITPEAVVAAIDASPNTDDD